MQNDIMDNNIVFGKNPVLEALKSGNPVNKVLFAQSLHRDKALNLILDLLKEQHIPFQWVPRNVLDREAPGQNHQGIIAHLGAQQYASLEDILNRAGQKNEPPFVLILDGVEDPHNLGALIRTAEAAGMHGIIIPRHRASGITPTVVKTSAGAAAHLPVCRCANLSQAIGELKEAGIWVAGVESSAEQLYHQADLTGPLAVVLGSEGKGISHLVRKQCDFLVRIPMRGQISSLNVSAAGAIIIYEAVRQKNT